MTYCKGCYSYGRNDCVYIAYRVEERTVGCPCMICLIKGVCNRACGEYEKFVIEIRLRTSQRADDIPRKTMEL